LIRNLLHLILLLQELKFTVDAENCILEIGTKQ